MKKDKVKKEISTPLKNNDGMVASHIKPLFMWGTANLEAKLMEKLVLLGMLHIRAFGTGKDLLMGKDYSNIIDQPHIKLIVSYEQECEDMFKVLERSGKATYLKEDDEQNYENDIYAHSNIYGRWRFDREAKKRKNQE